MSEKYFDDLVDLDVSRETFQKLEIFFALLKDWQKHINLISIPKNMSFDDIDGYIWDRHFLDSIQLYKYIDKEMTILDIGSGGGFPGLVIAAYGVENIYLVESDKRKCEFLKEAARQMEVEVSIVNDRVERVSDINHENNLLITSRACASISKLLMLTKQFHFAANYLLLKGEKANEELLEAEKSWNMTYDISPSMTNENASIVKIQGVRPHDE